MTNLPENGEPSEGPLRLTDPESFGEDLSFNLRAVSDLAEKHCGSCQGYHTLHVAKRLVPFSGSIEMDRQEIAAVIAKLAAEQLASGRSPLEVVIAGAADTGLLATAAHGIALIGEAALSLTRFTVLDRCRTPLELCLHFGRLHDLTLETEVVEFARDTAGRTADLVVVHSLFRFLPQDSHLDVLRRFGRWLRPGGRIVFSNKLDEGGEIFERDQRDFEEDVRRRLGDGQLQPGESAAAFGENLGRRTVVRTVGYNDPAGLQTLFERAGLPVLASQVVGAEVRLAGQRTTRYRAVVVLGPPSSPAGAISRA